MIVLLDAFAIKNKKTGVSQYSIELIKNMALLSKKTTFRVAIRPDLDENHLIYKMGKEFSNIRILKANIPAIGPLRDLKYLFFKNKLEYDIYHCLSSNLPLTMSKNSVVTIHDLKYLLFPEYLGKFGILKSIYLNAVFRHAVKKADGIITVSNSTRDDLIKIFAIKHGLERIKTVYEASFLKKGNEKKTADKYFLYIGELRPHKNIGGLIEGFKLFKKNCRTSGDVKLKIAGKTHKTFYTNIRNRSDIEFIGYVDDKDLYSLYKNSIALCLISNYEGFGLPILEAMESKTAVITSNRSSTGEIAGDAALTVFPENMKEIAKAMESLFLDKKLRNDLIKKGTERAGLFSWEKAAEETLSIYTEIYNRK